LCTDSFISIVDKIRAKIFEHYGINFEIK
jgi:hypothetical protein